MFWKKGQLNGFAKKVQLKRESKKPLALISSRASSSVVVVLFAKGSPCKVWRQGSTSTSSHTSLSRLARVTDFIMSYVRIATFGQWRACATLKFSPHAHVDGNFTESNPYQRAIPSLNSPLVKSKYLFNGSAFSQHDAPFFIAKSREYAFFHWWDLWSTFANVFARACSCFSFPIFWFLLMKLCVYCVMIL